MDNVTTFQFALKEMYTGQMTENLVYKNRPFLSRVPKKYDFGGKYYPQPLIYANASGGSATFAKASSNQKPLSGVEFQVTRRKEYQLITIDRELIVSANGDAESFLNGVETLMNSNLDNLSRRLAWGIYGDGNGVAAQISASSGVGTTLTLANLEDVVKFEVGQTLVASTAATGLSLKTGTMAVTGIDRDAGTLTVSPSGATLNAILAVSDYLYVDGDAAAKFHGLAAWIPTSAPSSAAFFGVDRTVDTQRLSGVRHDGTATNIREALIDGGTKIFRAGGRPDEVYMNPTDWAKLEKQLETTRQILDNNDTGSTGFRFLEIYVPWGSMKVIADPDCYVGLAYALQMDTWVLRYSKFGPGIFDDDFQWIRSSNADAYEVRAGCYGNLMCRAPGYNAVIQVS